MITLRQKQNKLKETRAEYKWLKMEADGLQTDIRAFISPSLYVKLMLVHNGVSDSKKWEILPQPPTVKNGLDFTKLRHKY
jgi:hypothetical protein